MPRLEPMNPISDIIIDAFQSNHKKLIEAGVGSGKTLNALVAAADFSLKQNKKVVFATGANTMQEENFKKDLLDLRKIFEGQNLKIAQVKARNSYISMKRFELFQEKKQYLDHEVTFLIKITIWLQKTATGDMDELNFMGKEFSLLDSVCCNEYACPHENSEFKNGCFFIKSQEKADIANIIIINHTLMIRDAIPAIHVETHCNASLHELPVYSHLIIDEADILEKAARESLTTAFSLNALQKPFESLKNVFKDIDVDTNEKIALFLRKSEIFFGLLGIFLEKESAKNPSNQGFLQCNLLNCDRQSKEWLAVNDCGAGIIKIGQDIVEETTKYSKEYCLEGEKEIMELKTILAHSEKIDLNEIILIFKNPEQNIFIKRSPVHIDRVLHELLFTRKESIIFISDTLRTDHSFHYIRRELGLGPEFEEIVFPPHFINPEQIKVLIPESLPGPMTEGYFTSCARLISDIIQKNRGRTLALFTSKKALSSMYHGIAPELKALGFHVLAQGISGGRGKILEHFKDEPHSSAIFATSNFWENITFSENELNCVIIHKLTFDFPDDPLVLARSKDYIDSFNDYYLPRAILRFKKTFNQFIVNTAMGGETDKGGPRPRSTMIILDNRITQKAYGKQFLESLPEEIEVINHT